MTPALGQLQVRVYTSRAKIPVAGATVVVTQGTPSGTFRLLTVQITDSSGYIRPIEIPAPPPEESTAPQGEDSPFTTCDVWAEHPSFSMLLVEGVQVFAGESALQSMVLQPLSEGEASLAQTQLYQIAPQAL